MHLQQSGEELLREKFGTSGIHVGTRIHPFFKSFMESQQFFFLATSNAKGECDCSFRGGIPPVVVLDDQTLIFPDYAGNGAFQSLGNILENPHVGMLFVNFEHAIRIRINGRAEIIDTHPEWKQWFPTAIQFVKVTTQEVYGNCNARIPRLVGKE